MIFAKSPFWAIAGAAKNAPRWTGVQREGTFMLRTILIYGLIGGLIVSVPMNVMMLVWGKEAQGSLVIGYTTMIVALTTIFIGVKSYRDKALGGVIKFFPALLVGLGISVVASVIYVAAWDLSLALTHWDFMADYTRGQIEAQKAKGVAGPQLDAFIAEMNAMKVNYANPLFRWPMTFIEPFPVGVLISLISAALLRNSRFMPARKI